MKSEKTILFYYNNVLFNVCAVTLIKKTIRMMLLLRFAKQAQKPLDPSISAGKHDNNNTIQ